MGEVPANMLAILEAKFDYLLKIGEFDGARLPFSDKCWRNGQALSLSPRRSTSEIPNARPQACRGEPAAAII